MKVAAMPTVMLSSTPGALRTNQSRTRSLAGRAASACSDILSRPLAALRRPGASLKLPAGNCNPPRAALLRRAGRAGKAGLPRGHAMNEATRPLTYADAGVDIDAGNRMVELIKPHVRSTRRRGADAEIGGFGGLFDLKAAGFADPILVAANDGVGTKVKIAIESGIHHTVGIDLVAMCVNDLVVQGVRLKVARERRAWQVRARPDRDRSRAEPLPLRANV